MSSLENTHAPLRSLLLKLVGMFVLVIGLVAGVIWLTLDSGHTLSKTADNLVTRSVPQMREIGLFQSALNKRMIDLYLYYATTERRNYQSASKILNDEIAQRLQEVVKLGLPAADSEALTEQLKRFENKATQFDRNMQSSGRDWDVLRQLLAEAQTESNASTSLLEKWGELIRSEVGRGSQNTLHQMSRLTNLLLGFSLVVLLIAGLVLVSFYRNFKDADSLRRLSIFPERNPMPILRMSAQGEVDYANPAAERLLEQLDLGQDPRKLLPENWLEDFNKQQDSGENMRGEDNIVRFEHSIKNRLFQMTTHYLPDLGRFHLYMEDISLRKAAERELIRRALYDDLTGLPNRRSLEMKLQEYLQKKGSDRQCAIMLLKLDSFKMVNGTYGHEVGDRLLKSVTEWINNKLEVQGVRARLYRFASSAWMLLLLGNRAEAEALVKELLTISNQPLDLGDREITASCSIGVTIYPDDGNDVSSLLRNADAAAIVARDEGANMATFFSNTLRLDAEKWLDTENALRRAIPAGEFELYYQPKTHVNNLRPAGSEALIRWRHDGQFISPAEFIPVAEQSGLIEQIGDWVLETACRQWKKWQSEGLPPFPVAVNVSAQQFQRATFPALVLEIMQKTQMPPDYLELEITEAVAAEHPELVVSTMQSLKDLGLSLAIDDFGTGYSSLSYLKRFPLDILKIDQAFMREIKDSSSDAAIAWLILSLGHELKLKVVAEGVETEAQLKLLMDWGCDVIQGYYFSKPLPADEFQQYVRMRLALPEDQLLNA